MDNKKFHELVLKTVNKINNDNRTGEVQSKVKEILEKYNIGSEDIKVYNENTNYRGIFLNIYYTLSRIEEIQYEIDPDYSGNTGYIVALTCIKNALIKMGIYSEYASGTVTEEKFEKIKSEFGL